MDMSLTVVLYNVRLDLFGSSYQDNADHISSRILGDELGFVCGKGCESG